MPNISKETLEVYWKFQSSLTLAKQQVNPSMKGVTRDRIKIYTELCRQCASIERLFYVIQYTLQSQIQLFKPCLPNYQVHHFYMKMTSRTHSTS